MDMQVKSRLKIQVQREVLCKALALATRFVEKNSRLPILNCLLIRGDGDVTLTGTNLDQTITVPLQASTAAVGAVCVPAHQLYQLVKGLPKGAAVELSEEGELQQHLVVRSGVARFQLPLRAPEDFPAEPLEHVKSSFTMPAQLLRDMIGKTKLAISTEETRFYLQGICVNVQQTDGLAYAVATDGIKLAEFSFPLPHGAATFKLDGDQAGIIIPRAAVLELERVLTRDTGEVTVKLYTGGDHNRVRIAFTTPQWDIITKMIDGTFPDWKRVMPAADSLPVLRFDSTAARALLANVRTAHGDSAKAGRAVRLTMSGEPVLRMDATGFDYEGSPVTAAGSIEATWGAGTELEIGINGRYFAELLELIPGDVVMKIENEGSPFTILNPADSRVVYVMMGMRV